MVGTAEAALLVVMNDMDGERWYTSTKQLQETSLQVCAAVRSLPRANLFVLDNTPPSLLPIAVAGEALPDNNGLAHGTRVPRIRVLSVKWDLLSTAVLTRYMPALADVEEMVFSERFDDRVQAVAWPDSVVCLEFGDYFDQEIDGVQWPAHLEQLTFGGLFNQGLGGATWPSTVNLVVVSDDFEHATDGITSSTGSRVEVLMPCMLN